MKVWSHTTRYSNAAHKKHVGIQTAEAVIKTSEDLTRKMRGVCPLITESPLSPHILSRRQPSHKPFLYDQTGCVAAIDSDTTETIVE